MMKKGGGSLFPPLFYVQQSAGKIFGGGYRTFCVFFYANEDCICELHWRNNKGSLLRDEDLPFDKFEEFP